MSTATLPLATDVITDEQRQSLSKFCTSKFHPLCFELGVSLEMTLPYGTEPVYSAEQGQAFPHLVYKKGELVRVYHPAVLVGDAPRGSGALVCFVPWVVSDEKATYRLCFRLRPIVGNFYRQLAFARFGEENAFAFSFHKNGGTFINLNFLGFGVQEFEPLYCKVRTPSETVEYYKISAYPNEECVTVEIENISAGDAPSTLQEVVLK